MRTLQSWSSKSAEIICINFKWREFLLDFTWHCNVLYIQNKLSSHSSSSINITYKFPWTTCQESEFLFRSHFSFWQYLSCTCHTHKLYFHFPHGHQGSRSLNSCRHCRAMALWPLGLPVHLGVDCSLPVYTIFRNKNFRNLDSILEIWEFLKY